jgi:nitrate/TMAO reductase-like tetraheme cytochrome c subunit
MAGFEDFKKDWLRPFLFYGNNPVSLIGGALTSGSALVLLGFWVVALLGRGGSTNPYIGLIVDLGLPSLFVLGLLLIALGIYVRRARLKKSGAVPSLFPEINFKDPVFRHGVDFVVVATFVNFIIVGTAAYRGVSYMDQPSFCGQTCHVMAPEWAAYHVSTHSGVACTECHIAPGVGGFVHAKLNGTKQLAMVLTGRYPRPIMADGKIPSAEVTCMKCHDSRSFLGDKLQIEAKFGDDEHNSLTHTLVMMHVGGSDSFARLSGIHGAHLSHIEYVATDVNTQTIPWVAKTNADGSVSTYSASSSFAAPAGQRRTMGCTDCHNRAAHSFDTPEEALNKDMLQGRPSAVLPFVHRQGLLLLKTPYTSQQDAADKIKTGLENFYRTQYPDLWSTERPQIEQAAQTLIRIYGDNVFPFMKVTWGSHPNNLGHNDYPGCFRCHDGSHNTKAGQTLTNDCSVCHNLIAVDEVNPKQLADLGIQ